MSLVVARKNESGIIFVSDTALILPNDENNPSALTPQLKVSFIFPDIALAFAGTIHFADVSVMQLVSMPEFNLEDSLKILVTQNIASGNETDFILAISKLNEIYEIKNGKAVKVETSWVGNYHAFNRFQQYFHGLDNAQPLSIRMSDSMKFIIEEPSFRTVSGFVVRADNCDDDRNFRYQISTEMISGNETITIPSGVAIPIPFGNAASGAHRIDVFPCKANVGCTLGLYFEVGEFGFIWTTPGVYNSREKLSNVTRAEFEYQVIQNFNLEPMIGLSWQDYFKTAVKMLKEMNFPLAELYCDRGINVQTTRSYIPDREEYFKIFSLKAEALVKQGKFLEAEKVMEIAIENSPVNKELHYYLGLILTDLGVYDRALISLSRAIEIDPVYSEPYNARGQIKLAMRIDDHGRADLQKYAELIYKK